LWQGCSPVWVCVCARTRLAVQMAPGEGAETADSFKAKGNEEFKAARYEGAIEGYSQSLALDGTQHLCFSNRSAAYLKLGGKAEEARQDAERCVELMPSFPKGYSRLAAALQELSRWDEAADACRRGLEAVPGDDTLKKMQGEVLTRGFSERIRGPWHGTVHPELGGYDQEMEFLDGREVKITVMAKPVFGSYSLNCSHDPHFMDIQVRPDPSMMPPGAPMMAPPVMPHIIVLDGDDLKICCPFMTNSRPTSFEGPGLCVMHRGAQPAKNCSEDLVNLSAEEKLIKCAEELLEVFPDCKLEDPTQMDSEEVVGQKIKRSVKFQSEMFQLEQRFGDASIKDVLQAVKAQNSPAFASQPKLLQRLESKLKVCGLFDDMPMPPPEPVAEAPKVVSGPPPAADPAKSRLIQCTDDPATDDAASKQQMLIAGVLVLGAAAATAAFVWSRRKNR